MNIKQNHLTNFQVLQFPHQNYWALQNDLGSMFILQASHPKSGPRKHYGAFI